MAKTANNKKESGLASAIQQWRPASLLVIYTSYRLKSTRLSWRVITMMCFILFASLNRRATSLRSFFVGMRPSMWRRSSTILGDCRRASRKLFSMVRGLLPKGLFISHFKPLISISGVLACLLRSGTKNVTSHFMTVARKSAASFSCLSIKTPGGTTMTPIRFLAIESILAREVDV